MPCHQAIDYKSESKKNDDNGDKENAKHCLQSADVIISLIKYCSWKQSKRKRKQKPKSKPNKINDLKGFIYF